MIPNQHIRDFTAALLLYFIPIPTIMGYKNNEKDVKKEIEGTQVYQVKYG